MAHFAKIEDGVVTNVIVVDNSDTLDSEGSESEDIGKAFCNNLFGGEWVQTSYNSNIRKNYASIGGTYDSTKDAFIPIKPYPSWVLNETTCQWENPTGVADPSTPPDDLYCWNEDTTSWTLIEEGAE